MSDTFYRVVKPLGLPAFVWGRRPTILGLERVPREGACIVAANHSSPYDIPLLIIHCPRPIDFLAAAELFRHPILRRFYRAWNAIPTERSRADLVSARAVLERLERGRAMGIFPEGGLRKGDASVLAKGGIRSGLGKIAALSQAPVVPTVILESDVFRHSSSWMPWTRTRYGVAFDAPLDPPSRSSDRPALDRFEAAYVAAMRALCLTLERAMRETP